MINFILESSVLIWEEMENKLGIIDPHTMAGVHMSYNQGNTLLQPILSGPNNLSSL